MEDCTEPVLRPSKKDAAGNYGISLVTLKKMMELNKDHAIINLQNIGGVTELCHKLHTSSTNGTIYFSRISCKLICH